jgi:hypothetical protein
MGTPRGCLVSPVVRVKHYRGHRPHVWIIRALFAVLLLLAALALVLR